MAIYRWDKITFFPGAKLGALSSPVSVDGNVVTYSANTLSLQPLERYYLVFTATEPLADHPASLIVGGTSYVTRDGWFLFENAKSSDGVNWGRGGFGRIQLAINATLVPEPGTMTLFALGGALLLFVHRPGRRNRP